jgi:hypothetical protein
VNVSTAGRLLPITLLCAYAASGCFWFDRPNPRLAQAVRSFGDVEEKLTLTYDDGAYLTRVVLDEQAATQTLELSWQGGVLESVSVKKDPKDEAFPTDTSLVRFKWEEGRVVSATETFEDNNPDDTLDAPVTKSTVTYDDSGRFEKLEQNKSANGAYVIDVTDFLYDDGGNLSSIDSTLRVLVGAEETSRAVTERDFEVKDGAPSSIEIRNGGNTTLMDVDQDDEGRVDGFDVTYKRGADPENESQALVGFSYGQESGLLTALTVSDDDGLTDDPLTELSYDEGEAAGLDVTPYTIFGYGIWDLTGKSHLTLDPATQAARFMMPLW